MWMNPSIAWEPKEFDDIMVVNNVDLGTTWTPDLSVHK